jgi:hypothetical protein
VVIVNRPSEILEGCQRVTEFALKSCQGTRQVRLIAAITAVLGDGQATDVEYRYGRALEPLRAGWRLRRSDLQ